MQKTQLAEQQLDAQTTRSAAAKAAASTMSGSMPNSANGGGGGGFDMSGVIAKLDVINSTLQAMLQQAKSDADANKDDTPPPTNADIANTENENIKDLGMVANPIKL